MKGILTLMGSGETSPTMVKTHRRIMERIGPDRPRIMLDTPFGFQENADIIADKAVRYFETSLGETVEVATFRSAERASDLERATLSSRVREAGWVFAAPGSPTYAVRQWHTTDLSELLVENVAGRGGAVTFASAAAVTLGTHVLPVYEIYKVGEPVHWQEGLDVLGKLGWPCAVIPHFNNAEGGNHDTRFCYMGATRLRSLQTLLDPTVPIIGIDEHTAAVIDLEAAQLQVEGLGTVTILLGDQSNIVATGESVPLEALRGEGGSRHNPGYVVDAGPDADVTAVAVDPLRDAITSADGEFTDAFGAGDAAAATAAALELDQALTDWSTDTLQSDLPERGRSLLRSMIVRLGEAAQDGLTDPADRIGDFVDLVLEIRASARENGDYSTSDRLRDGLAALGIEVRDGVDGATWVLASGT